MKKHEEFINRLIESAQALIESNANVILQDLEESQGGVIKPEIIFEIKKDDATDEIAVCPKFKNVLNVKHEDKLDEFKISSDLFDFDFEDN